MSGPSSRSQNNAVDVAQSVCPSQSAWQALDSALDINNTLVHVYQPPRDSGGTVSSARGGGGAAALRQWFYTVTCRNDVAASLRHCPGCCLAIDHTRYRSSCEQKRTYVMAYASRTPQRRYEWTWIQVNTSCSCAFSSRRRRPHEFADL